MNSLEQQEEINDTPEEQETYSWEVFMWFAVVIGTVFLIGMGLGTYGH